MSPNASPQEANVVIRAAATVVPSSDLVRIEATVSTAEGEPITLSFAVQIREKADLLDGGAD